MNAGFVNRHKKSKNWRVTKIALYAVLEPEEHKPYCHGEMSFIEPERDWLHGGHRTRLIAAARRVLFHLGKFLTAQRLHF